MRGRARRARRLSSAGRGSRASGRGVVQRCHLRIGRREVAGQTLGPPAQALEQSAHLAVDRFDPLEQGRSRLGHRGEVGTRLGDRLLARLFRIPIGVAAHLRRVLQCLALDIGGGRLGRVQDALHLGASRRCERWLLAAREPAAELLDLPRQRAQVRVDGGRLVAAPDDRKVTALDRLTVHFHW